MAGQLVATDSEAVEQAYVAYRDEVMTMLRASFAGVADLDEIYQEAWAEALELQAEGHEIRDLQTIVRVIAWRRGRDLLRRHQATTVDPNSLVFAGRADASSSPDETVEAEVDAAVIWQVVDSLEPREAAVIKMRFGQHLNSKEIQRELGVTAKRLEKIVTRAYAQVEQALTANDGEESAWRRRQRSLLLACETGLASAAQRRQAQRIVREDPACRAMLREIRSTLEGVAAILPLPVLAADGSLSRLDRLRADAVDRLAAIRDWLSELFSRVVPHGGSVEAGAGGAATIGGGVAIKAALTCVAVTGTAVVCVTSGVINIPDRPPPEPKKTAPKTSPAAVAPSTPTPVAVATPPVKITKARSRPASEPVEKAAAPPAPSPAPSGSTEFGPGAVGSTAASSVPASAPDNGSDEFTP